MKINLLVVGKLKEKYWVDAQNEYLKRLSRYAKVEIIELDECKTLQEEAQAILKKLSGFVIVFDIKGKMVSSVEFANLFSTQMNYGASEFTLIIGSSEGLSDSVKEKADYLVSFGLVTYPHQLMRVIALEQIYRSITINNHLTYHK